MAEPTATLATRATTLLTQIQTQQSQNPTSILTLAEPTLLQQQQSQPQQQSQNPTTPSSPTSSTSIPSTLNPTSATTTTLSADLTHYKSLFSKLRFSYLEQVTKEKYLRSIVGDPPILITNQDNMILEDRLLSMKSELKEKKIGVESLIGELDGLARKLAGVSEGVEHGLGVLRDLPARIEGLEAEVMLLRERIAISQQNNLRGSSSTEEERDARMNLSLSETQFLLDERRAQISDIDVRIQRLRELMPGKVAECESVEVELAGLESRRNEAARVAREVRRVREEGGRDELEDMARWFSGRESVMRGLLGV